MTVNDDTWETAFVELIDNAREMLADGGLHLDSRDGFMNVMWPDNEVMKRYGMTHEEYHELLLDVWVALTSEAEGGAK